MAAGWTIIANAADQFTVTARGECGTLVEMRWMIIASVATIADPASAGKVVALPASRPVARD